MASMASPTNILKGNNIHSTLMIITPILSLPKNRWTLSNSRFYTDIILIKPDSKQKQNHRPIFLMNIETKILSRILSNQMQ